MIMRRLIGSLAIIEVLVTTFLTLPTAAATQTSPEVEQFNQVFEQAKS